MQCEASSHMFLNVVTLQKNSLCSSVNTTASRSYGAEKSCVLKG